MDKEAIARVREYIGDDPDTDRLSFDEREKPATIGDLRALLAAADTLPATLSPAEPSPESREAWQPIETAPYGEAVDVRVGSMTLVGKLICNGAENEQGACDQWVAVNEGEHPPCWSGGACWESNEDEVTSIQPTAWRPLDASAIRALSDPAHD